eukprot:scaffold7970_cov125-Isochrysis_galbana.AAC.7
MHLFAHLEEEALLCVRATIIKLGYPTAAAATVTGVLSFAFAPVIGGLGSVWSPPCSQKFIMVRGEATLASTAAVSRRSAVRRYRWHPLDRRHKYGLPLGSSRSECG